ncbi:MAG: hypothetical protein J0665_15495 [Deltaproteobacteria bacterium]|nr:hypothetical protein [Deltaproteobacteria bacterium]
MAAFNGIIRNGRRFLTGIVLCLLIGLCAVARADDGATNIDPNGKFLEQIANNGIPAVYGEMLSALQESGAAGFTSAATQYVKSGSGSAKALTGLAAVTSTRNALNNMNQMFGRLFSAIDVTTKLGSGDTAAAAEAGAVWFVTELAGTEAGKNLLSGYGVTPPVVSALLVSYSIWRESEKALAAEEKGVKLESLYGTVEKITYSRGRSLGVGDPLPITQENIDKIWNRALTDSDFREGFKIYVTELLQKDFPDYLRSDPVADTSTSVIPGLGDQQPASDIAGQTIDIQPSTGGKEEMRPWIVALIGQLNRAKKVEEQRMLTYQQLKAVALRIQMNGSTVEQAMARFDSALVQLGIVASYLQSSPQDIKAAIEKDDYQTLMAHMKTVTDYTQNVIAWLPSKGPLAEVRAEYLAALKDRYKLAANGFNAFRVKLKQRIELPPLAAPVTSGSQQIPATGQATSATTPPPTIDPTDFYRNYLAPRIKPFDWGGAGEAEMVKAPYEQQLAKGKFKQTTMIEKAWEQQNFSLAMGNMEGITTLPPPREEETFAGYKKKLLTEVATSGKPGEIQSLHQTLQSQSESIAKLYKDGNCMVFPRWYECSDRPMPPADETIEQRRVRSAQGQAIMEQARGMSNALEPSRIQLRQLEVAWTKAHEMAISVIADQVAMAQLRHSELAAWMKTNRLIHEEKARQARGNLNNFRSAAASIALPALTGTTAGETALAQFEEWLTTKRYLGIGKIAEPEGRLLQGAEMVSQERSARLLGEARQLPGQANVFLSQAYTEAEAFAQGVPLFAEAVTAVTPAIDDIVIYDSPNFRDEFATLSRRSDRAKVLADKIRSAADSANGQLRQEIENRETDGYWLRTVAGSIRSFRDTALKWGMLDESGNKLRVPPPRPEITPNALIVGHPFWHYLTTAESNAVANKLRGLWSEGKLAGFSAGPAPWFGEQVKPYLDQVSKAPSTPEANFCVGEQVNSFTAMPVTTGGMIRAKQIYAAMVPGQQSFEDGFTSLGRALPMQVAFNGGYTGTFRDLYLGGWQNTPLGKEYLSFRNQLKEQYAIHLKLWAENQHKAQEQAAGKVLQQMDGWLATLQQRIATGDAMISRSKTLPFRERVAIEAAIKELAAFNDHLLDEPYRQTVAAADLIRGTGSRDEPAVKRANAVINQIGQLSSRLSIVIGSLKALLQQGPQMDLAGFYESFRQTYESRNESAVMAMISDGWESGDGTTLDDLQGYLHNSFTVFDQITYQISQLKYSWNGKFYNVSYDVTITGRNFRHNLKHEEKSSVNEEVSLDSSDKPRISRTLNGRFWYVQ